MKLFDGMDQIRRLGPARVKEFWQFYDQQFRTRLYPTMIAINTCFTLIAALLDIVLRAGKAGTLAVVHPLTYLYLALLGVVLVLNRWTPLREAYPILAYILFLVVATFSYLTFIGTQGDMGIFVSMAIYLIAIGFNTMSVKHTALILSINMLMLYGAVFLIAPAEEVNARYISLALNWLLLFEMILALSIAGVNRWLFAHFFALQFLLKQRNETLSETVRELHAVEDQLIQQQKHQALSHMAAGLLHELLNPVNSATQALTYAQSLAQDPDLREAIEDALINQRRIAAIISDLRTFSQTRQPLAPETVALEQLLQQALKLCATELDGIQIRYDSRTDFQLRGFPNALLQVLVNLLLNAAEALQEKRKRGLAEIRIRVETDNDTLRVCLRDNGKGIAPEHLKRLSEPFYSVDKQGANMGLGLSICQTIMRHHEGRMRFRSELGAWTEICLELPRLKTPSANAN